MNCLGKIAIYLTGGLVLSAGARAADVLPADNPYTPIVVRNVFGLNPPPTNAPAPPGDPPPKITVNGTMTILGQLQALFKVAAKPGPGNHEESYVLSEGQRQDDIEVTHIDEQKGVVTFNNHGVIQEIPLANAPSLSTPAPMVGHMPPGRPFPPGGFNNNNRGVMIPPRYGGNQPGMRPTGPYNNMGAGTGGSAPAYGGYQPPGGMSTSQGGQTLTPEERMVLIAAEHAKAQQEGSPTAALFPPTPLDKQAGIVPNTTPGGSLPMP